MKTEILKVMMLVAVFLLFTGTVLAHDPGLSAAEVRILPDRIVAEVSFAPADIPNNNIAKHLLEIKSGEQTLKLQTLTIQTRDANSTHFILEFPNPPAAELHLTAIAFEHLPRGHKQFLSVRNADGTLLAERMLSAESNTITLNTNSGSSSERFFRFLTLGIEHIFTGYDHMAFLLAVLLTGGSLLSNARIITSFTIAHSLTLALATFSIVSSVVDRRTTYCCLNRIRRYREPGATTDSGTLAGDVLFRTGSRARLRVCPSRPRHRRNEDPGSYPTLVVQSRRRSRADLNRHTHPAVNLETTAPSCVPA
jgi:hypothetical protein